MATKTLTIKVEYLDGLDTIEDPEERAEVQQDLPDFQDLKIVSVEVDGQTVEKVDSGAMGGSSDWWPILDRDDVCYLILELGYC